MYFNNLSNLIYTLIWVIFIKYFQSTTHLLQYIIIFAIIHHNHKGTKNFWLNLCYRTKCYNATIVGFYDNVCRWKGICLVFNEPWCNMKVRVQRDMPRVCLDDGQIWPALYCLLQCTELHWTLYWSALYCTWHCTLLNSTLHCIALYLTPHYTVLHCTSSTLHCTKLADTPP